MMSREGTSQVHRSAAQQGRARSGFTLVEVMVALAIVALALPALITVLYQQADDTAYLRDKSLAQMIASNKLEEIRLQLAKNGQLATGKETGASTMADRDWYWWVDIVNAPDVPQILRIDIRVGTESESKEASLYTLSAFVSSDRRQVVPAAGNPQNPDDPPNQPEQPGS